MPMYRKSMLVLSLLILAVLGGMFYGFHTQEQSVVLDAASESSPAAVSRQADVTVYVTGAVQKPGLVTVPEGARMADAVEACGGLLPTAAGDGLNMAQVLKDGQQVMVPERRQQQLPAVEGTKPAEQAGLVNINTADAKLLDTLPGIGPAMAQRIIEYRETQGRFESIEDLKRVRGIGEAKFAKLKDKICI